MKLIALQSQISWAEHCCKEEPVTAVVVETKRRKGTVGMEAGELGLSRMCPYGTAGISLFASSEAAVCFV